MTAEHGAVWFFLCGVSLWGRLWVPGECPWFCRCAGRHCWAPCTLGLAVFWLAFMWIPTVQMPFAPKVDSRHALHVKLEVQLCPWLKELAEACGFLSKWIQSLMLLWQSHDGWLNRPQSKTVSQDRSLCFSVTAAELFTTWPKDAYLVWRVYSTTLNG